jgi:hypothetical protein
MWPIRFMFLNAIAIGLASIPILAVLFPLADTIAGLQAPGATLVLWSAVILSTSIFWSLQTLVYLHLRTVVDDVDAHEIVTRPETNEESEAKPKVNMAEAARKAVASEPARPGSVFKRNVLGLIGVIATWCLTVWLFGKVGGDDAGWMNWGLGEEVVPAAKGLYSAAALLALLWGIMWIGLPILMTLRGFFRNSANEGQTVSPTSESPTSP